MNTKNEKHNNDNDDDEDSNWLTYFLVFMLLVCVIFASYIICKYHAEFSDFFPVKKGDSTSDRSHWGVLGDFFGGVLNPFFSIIGLVMILATFIQNQRELRLSRKEFKASTAALNSQASTLNKQRFEDTFFSLLDKHNYLLDKITSKKYQDSDITIAGSIRNAIIPNEESESGCIKFKSMNEAKNYLLSRNQEINQYFRVLYQILKFIASNCPSSTIKEKDGFSPSSLKETICSDEEKLYSNIVRSLLSDDIYYLLAINCYCHDGYSDDFIEYKMLIQRYALFEHMTPCSVSNIKGVYMVRNKVFDEICSHYSKAAFGKNRKMIKIIESKREFFDENKSANKQKNHLLKSLNNKKS